MNFFEISRASPMKLAEAGKQHTRRGRPPNSAYAVCGCNSECGELFRERLASRSSAVARVVASSKGSKLREWEEWRRI
jgi:hypothetical protein